MSLRHVLYHYVKMSDGCTLFGEIHQENEMSSVDVVVPNVEIASIQVGMMKKNLAAYLKFTLPGEGLDEAFVTRLINKAVDPSLIHSMQECKWDPKTKVLTTLRDEEEEAVRRMEQAAWYTDLFAAPGCKKGKSTPTYANPDNVYKLDDDHTVHSLHRCPGRYEGTPGAATIDLSGPKQQDNEVIEVDLEDAEGDLEKMSQADLIALIRKSKISGEKGSQPTSDDSKSSSNDSSSESDSQDDGSSSASSAPSARRAAASQEAAGEG